MTTKITDKNISELANAGVNWQSVFTGDGSTGLTAVAGRGYFIDTTSGTVTVTLPASPSAGDVVVLKDYARTWNTNNVTTASALFDGATSATTFSTEGQTVTLVYMDGTKGWSIINEDTTTGLGASFISATGGTITTSGDYKIHSFTGDGCFVVSSIGNPAGSDSVDYLVVAGGGGAGGDGGGGGGAGGVRFASGTFCMPSAPANPRAGASSLTVSATTYPITVGGGGAGAPPGSEGPLGGAGSNSVFSTITSTGGGGGGGNACGSGVNGGSGGGARANTGGTNPGGSGNTPPVSPSQGSDGGIGGSNPWGGAGGGGGMMATGSNGPAGPSGGPGGAGGGTGGDGGGFPTAFGSNGESSGCYQYYAGGGGGGSGPAVDAPTTAGGLGGGGNATGPGGNSAATANTGGGGGGGHGNDEGGGAGGKGIVVIRYKYQ